MDNGTWSILIQWIRVTLYDLVNTKESVLSVCEKPYHMNNEIQRKWEEIKNSKNHALLKQIPAT